ncbi:phosphoglycerate dehydrogenase [Demequina sp. TTPB684]|uniref:phosphoglycerate dehydrogenase n=1 Tax=unclassified Demequina TaxID=2620311 RepID=UPI001CF17159|nr:MULTISPECIES: phosphoglycerate dehydrogenase [unclassified Demequina]MCB2413747.1 phosphoglycerate dehydrogenase [Demequina sp. TTPB684]UPU89582.1 phosphoglycerate dehydrogenase [Demequina sp. TMPB413]
MTSVRALLLETLHPQATEILEAAGVAVENRAGALDEDELIEALQGVHLLGIRSKTQVTERVLKEAPDLIAVGAFSIGTNQIDLAAAARSGVATFNAPFSNTRSVVEMAVSEMISLTRRLPDHNRQMHAGVWSKSAIGAHEIRGRTLGIVGYGNIGSQLSVIAEALGMNVIFFDSAEKLALGNATKMPTLESLLREADIVTLHVDGRSGNSGFFGREQFEAMKPGALFLNLSRGFIVDIEGLKDCLESGQIGGAAVDVYPVEPKTKGDPFSSPLQGLANVILTPHIGGSTEEAQRDIGIFVSTRLRDYVHHGSTSLSVNLPNLSLDQQQGSHRIAHLHVNTPGVLAAVNQVFAEHGVNIEAQMLATRGELGYVVTDVAAGITDDAVVALSEMQATVRLRVLS